MSLGEIDAVSNFDPKEPGERARRSDRALDGIYEISRILTRPARLELTLANVTSALDCYFGLAQGLIVLLDEKNEYRIAVGLGWNDASARNYFDHIPQSVVRRVISTRKPVVVGKHNIGRNLGEGADAAGVEWQAQCSSGDCALIGVPIMDRDRMIGTITSESCDVESSPESVDEELNILNMVANLVGQTVRLQTLVGRDRERLMAEHRRSEKELETQAQPKSDLRVAGIIGESESVHSVLNKIRIVARSHLPVLLRGESGTGKELFAQAVHDLSPRSKGPLVKVNCAALPESMLESELFGHEKGAFTGALTQRKGRFELADGGTLFLDEIGEISPGFQAKLLRVLQEGEFQRVGGVETTKVDVRLVAATNRNLEEAVSLGEFRADLYFRICVVPILLAPLRERREDIPLLAREFLRRYNESHGTALEFMGDAIELLRDCQFPGNIRELESCVRRTAAFAHGKNIGATDFACQNDSCLSSLLWKSKPESRDGKKCISLPVSADPDRPVRAPVGGLGDFGASPPNDSPTGAEPNRQGAGDDANVDLSPERERLVEAMERAGWVQAKAARLLGLSSRQMGYALRKHSIEIKRF